MSKLIAEIGNTYWRWEDGTVIWWGIAALAGAAVIVGVPIWLIRWISSDAGVARESAKEQFRAEQEFRALRRAGK